MPTVRVASISSRVLKATTLATVLLVGTPGLTWAADNVTISISTSTGNDTLVLGMAGSVVFRVDSGPDTMTWATLYLQWNFSNGNVVGPLVESDTASNVLFSDLSESVFESTAWNPIYGASVTDPDTTLGGVTKASTSPPYWVGEHELMRLAFTPTDTGQIDILCIVVPDGGSPDPYCSVGTPDGTELTIQWVSPTITVVRCGDASIQSGDANFDRTVTSADIIYLVNHVFKGGPEPILWNLGDDNCSGTITSADIIYLVNFVFKSGPAPCDLCSSL